MVQARVATANMRLRFRASCWAIVYYAGQHLNGIGAVYTMCTLSCQHVVLTRAEWILASTRRCQCVCVVCISPMSGHCVRPWPMHVLPSHEVPTRAEWILASTGDAGPTFNRPACYWTQPNKHEALNQCWLDAGPASQTVGHQWSDQHWVNVSCLLGVLTSHIVFHTSAWFHNGIINTV